MIFGFFTSGVEVGKISPYSTSLRYVSCLCTLYNLSMRFLIVVTLIGIYNLAFPQPDTIYVLDSIVVFDSIGNLAIKGGSSQTIVLDEF